MSDALPLIRLAVPDDLPAIVGMLANDPLGATRERFADPPPETYVKAFGEIERDPNNELIVAHSREHGVIAVLQLTFTPFLIHQGGWRASIEGVRVHGTVRGMGVGRHLVGWAVARAEDHGCYVVQLTTDKQRPEAQRFYESLGFVASHEGMKLRLK